MTVTLWVKIPNLDPYKPNKVPLKIGDTVYGEVLEVLKQAPGNQYKVKASIFPYKQKEFIEKIQQFR